MAKYIMTIVFESNDRQEDVERRFQNGVCTFEATQRINIAHLKKNIGHEERPTLETLQILRPEDCASWNLRKIEKFTRLAQVRKFIKSIDAKADIVRDSSGYYYFTHEIEAPSSGIYVFNVEGTDQDFWRSQFENYRAKW